MMGTEISKRGNNELSLDFGEGRDLSLEGLTAAQQNELIFKLQSKKLEVAVGLAERKTRLESSVADSANVISSTVALDNTKVDFNITSESETASGTMKISVHKNNNLALYILIALGILAVLAIAVFKGRG